MRRRSHLGNKTTRRALIRLRHALAAEKFSRWLERSHRYSLQREAHKVWPREWHQWHALGCP
jgi:hypothetical protein